VLTLRIIQRVMRLREALHRHPVTGELHPDDAAWLRETTPQSPILRPCSFCGAKPMRECTTMGGKKRKFHQQRRRPTRGRR
jgi:hypothetical protein